MSKTYEVKIGKKKYEVRHPGIKEYEVANLAKQRRFKECIQDDNYFLKDNLNKILTDKGYWTKEKDEELDNLQKELGTRLEKLEDGGIELDAAKSLAVEVKILREAINSLTMKNREFAAFTVEHQADDAYFDTLVAECTYKAGKRAFSNLKDYIEKSTEDYAVACARKLMEVLYGLSDKWETKLPENEFLIEYGYMDENMNFTDAVYGSEVKGEPKEEKKKKPFLKNGEPVEPTKLIEGEVETVETVTSDS